MKINSKDLLIDARKKRYAIPATNFIDLDSARAYTNTAARLNKPLILAYAEPHKDILTLEEAAVIGNYFSKKQDIPIVLHLDHGSSLDFIFKAIEYGFSSVMIDASTLPFEENIRKTKKVADYAHKFGVTVEAELGHVGSNENFENHELSNSIYTEVSDVINFIDETKIDSLAISIGTAHGNYVGTPKINFKRLKEIAQSTEIPLVLHGGSSSGDDNLRKCSYNGISKINIFTDFLNAAYETNIQNNSKSYLEMKSESNQAMENVLEHYYRVFNTKSFIL